MAFFIHHPYQHPLEGLVEPFYQAISLEVLEVLWCLTCSSQQRSAISLEMKGVPCSKIRYLGIPTQLKRSISSFMMLLDVALRRGMASGYQIA